MSFHVPTKVFVFNLFCFSAAIRVNDNFTKTKIYMLIPFLLNTEKNLISFHLYTSVFRNTEIYFASLAMPTWFQVKKRIRSNYLRLAQKMLWLFRKSFACMQTTEKMCLHQVRVYLLFNVVLKTLKISFST